MAISCDTNSLMEGAKCIQSCIPDGMRSAVIIYLLQSIAGTNLTTDQLMDAAKCYKCIPPGMQAEVQTYLLCAIVNK